jgi:hypothetical protein
VAFKIGNQTVIQDIDASAVIETNSNLDKLQINNTDVLVHDGSTITLKNVELDSSIGIDSDSITEGTTNKFYSTDLFNTDFATKDTDDLTEGSNLYYTDARAVTALIPTTSALLPLAGGTMTGDLILDGAPTAALQAATKAYVDSAVSSGTSGLDTDDIPEGTTNLYYTNARVGTYLTNNNFAIEAYVDQAELDAIATASADATTKADQAEVDAKAYTDTRETAITTAYESYADQAEVDAKAYTDTRETAITTAYESYANTGDTTTYNASKSYTDTEIATVLPLSGGTLTGALTLNGAPTGSNNAATKAYVDSAVSSGTGALDTDDVSEASNLYYTDARVNTLLGTKNYATETYVDSAVAGVVDSAPAALDTLNELAAALGDDPNLSTTLSTQIGTKVAKAGDTMTGALTLSGAPSSANHAATKAYVDSSVSGGTGALDTDDITEAGNLYYTDARVDARIPTNVSSFTNDSGYITSFTDTNTTYTAGTGLNLVGTTFNNTAPDQTVSLTGSGATSISGTYPNFTISSTDTNTDTNTTYTAGNGLTLTSTEFKMSGSYTGSFTATGDVTAYSDERLKSNITTIEDALSKVKSMRGVMFDKEDSLSGDLQKSTGVIAQETEKVLPEVVHNHATGYKSVAYGNMVGILIEAIKEQQQQIDKLANEVEFLKGKR